MVNSFLSILIICIIIDIHKKWKGKEKIHVKARHFDSIRLLALFSIIRLTKLFFLFFSWIIHYSQMDFLNFFHLSIHPTTDHIIIRNNLVVYAI